MNTNTEKSLDLYIVDNLSVKFYFHIFIIRTKNNSFSYDYLKTIQLVLVHISKAYWEVL